MPRYEVIWDGCKRVTMQNVAGWSNVPVRCCPDRNPVAQPILNNFFAPG
jgi:hypothetical protein